MHSLYKIELKRLLRDRVNWVFIALILATTVYGLWQESLTALHGFRFLHQLVVWWAVFCGYRIAVSQRVAGTQEWMLQLPNKEKRTAAQIGALFLVFLFVAAGMSAIAVIAYFFSEFAFDILGQTLLAILLYYLLSMLIAGAAGWLLGQAIPKLYGYLIAAFFGYFLGSIGSAWLFRLFEPYPGLQPLAPTFGFPPGTYFTPILGYNLSSGQWLKYLFWLGVCLIIAVLLYGTDKRKKIAAGVLGFAVVITGALAVQDPGASMVKPLHDFEGLKEESAAYWEIEDEPLTDPAFHWKTMDLQLDSTDAGLFVEGRATLLLLEPQDMLKINLHRNFVTDAWTVDGEKKKTAQEDDIITVDFGEEKEAGQEMEVRFSYHGVPYGEYFATDSLVILPNYYNWVPQPKTAQSFLFRNGEIMTVGVQEDVPVQYNVHWQKDMPSWTNASEGMRSDGITFFAGYINQVERDGITYVYTDADPVAAERNSRRTIEQMHKTAEILGISMPEISTVMCINSEELRLDGIAQYGLSSRLAGNTYYIKGNGAEFPPVLTNEDRHLEFFLCEALAAVLMNDKAFLYQDEYMQLAFFNGFVYPHTNYVAKYIPYPELITFLDTEEDTDGFLRAWYGEMRENTGYTREDLQNLMEEWSQS